MRPPSSAAVTVTVLSLTLLTVSLAVFSRRLHPAEFREGLPSTKPVAEIAQSPGTAPESQLTVGTETSFTPAATPVPLAEMSKTGVIQRFLTHEQSPTLTEGQVAEYLSQNQGSAEALVTAFRFTKDLALLRDAARISPENPQGQLQLALHSNDPAERRHAVDALRQNAPDNALGDYLSALDHFRTGNAQKALSEIAAAAGKGSLDDYAPARSQAAEEAFMAAGYSVSEAKAAAVLGLERTHLAPLREISTQLAEAQARYVQRGDTASAQAIGNMGLTLAEQMQSGAPCLIDELVANSIEKKFLSNLAPPARQARLDEIQQRKEDITRMMGTQAGIQMNDAEAIAFFDRQKLYGEFEALRWLGERHAGN